MDIRASTVVQALLFIALSVGALNDARADDSCPYCTAKYHTCINNGNPQAVCNAEQVECMEQYCGFGFTPPAKAFDKTKSLINPGYTDKSLVAAISDQPAIAAPH
ncbi:MAG: hypothetical protein ACYC0F_09115 [Rhodanobacter sp.]